MSATAVGFANAVATMCVMGSVCLAMIFDFGVGGSQANRNVACRTLQGIAGFTGLAHVTRVIMSTYFGNYLIYDPGGIQPTEDRCEHLGLPGDPNR